MIHSDKIQLRKTEEDDLAFVIETERNKENSPYIGQWTHEEHRSALADPDMLSVIIEDAAGKHAGYVIVTGLNNLNLSVCIMRIVVTEKGHGYGKEVLQLLKEWLFRNTAAHRLWLDVREHNGRARHVYEAAGFTYEGTWRDCVKVEHGFESLQFMSILRTEYEAEQ